MTQKTNDVSRTAYPWHCFSSTRKLAFTSFVTRYIRTLMASKAVVIASVPMATPVAKVVITIDDLKAHVKRVATMFGITAYNTPRNKLLETIEANISRVVEFEKEHKSKKRKHEDTDDVADALLCMESADPSDAASTTTNAPTPPSVKTFKLSFPPAPPPGTVIDFHDGEFPKDVVFSRLGFLKGLLRENPLTGLRVGQCFKNSYGQDMVLVGLDPSRPTYGAIVAPYKKVMGRYEESDEPYMLKAAGDTSYYRVDHVKAAILGKSQRDKDRWDRLCANRERLDLFAGDLNDGMKLTNCWNNRWVKLVDVNPRKRKFTYCVQDKSDPSQETWINNIAYRNAERQPRGYHIW